MDIESTIPAEEIDSERSTQINVTNFDILKLRCNMLHGFSLYPVNYAKESIVILYRFVF